MKTVNSKQEAWNMVNSLIDWDYEQNMQATENAGYPIYMSTRKDHDAWISDLNTSLEINTPDGKSTRIVIKDIPVPHHFEINIKASTFSFTYQCATAYEAYKAIEDAVISFKFNEDMDKIMEILIRMKNGNCISIEDKHFYIAYREGEV